MITEYVSSDGKMRSQTMLEVQRYEAVQAGLFALPWVVQLDPRGVVDARGKRLLLNGSVEFLEDLVRLVNMIPRAAEVLSYALLEGGSTALADYADARDAWLVEYFSMTGMPK